MTRTVSLENLPPEQRASVERMCDFTGSAGTVENVMLGPAEWDLRPVLVSSGERFILRFSDPSCRPGSDGFAALRAAVRALSAGGPLAVLGKAGEADGRVWIRRPYAPRTLDAALDPFSSDRYRASRSQVIPFLELMNEAHRAGLVHGHLVPSNVGIFGERLVPLDFGLHAVAERGVPLIFQDILSLGQLMKALMERELRESEAALVTRMLDPQPGKRPGLDEVLSEMRRSVTVVAAPRIISSGGSAPLGSGRKLPAHPGPDPSAAPGATPAVKGASAPKTEPSREQTPGAVKLPSWSATAVLGGLLLLLLIYRVWGSGSAPLDASELASLWKSDDAGDMAEVVREAMNDPDSEAARIIIDDIARGRRHPQVRSDVLRIGFNPLWASQLSAADRRTLFTLALGDLISPDERTLEPLGDLHPAVVFSLAATVPVDNQGTIFGAIPVTHLAKLPDPVGPPFALLERLGVMSAAEPPPRALAHLVVGDSNVPIAEAYFVKPSDSKIVSAQLQMLLPFVKINPAIVDPLMTFLQGLSGEFAAMSDWFNEKLSVDWTTVGKVERLALMTGTLPAAKLAPEQYIDLLQFPAKETRAAAKEHLGKNYFSKAHRGMLLILASDENRLTRDQSLLLVTALHLPDEQSFAFFSKWFEHDPDPQTIFLLILSRSKAPRSSPFDVEASRYLINCKCPWSAAPEELALLVGHPEPLARALGYARLDPADPKQREVLERRVKVETNDKMREQVKRKLELIQ